MREQTTHSSAQNLRLAVGIGLFVALFLLVFRPFGLTWDNGQDPVFWLIVSLAPLNTGLILILDKVISSLGRAWPIFRNWYVGFALTITSIIAGNVSYQFILQGKFRWQELLSSVWEVALIAIFPTLFILLYYRRKSVSPDSSSNKVYSLQDEFARETLTLQPNDLLYISADRNYVLVHTISREQPHLLRSSLKEVEKQLAGTSVIRCHRSFLVNTSQIVHRKKHARGIELSLKDCQDKIPVSNSYVDALEKVLNTPSS